ncbi:MAG: mechanosensitive ion channel family protein [bacterium]
MGIISNTIWKMILSSGLLILGIALGFSLSALLFKILSRWARHTSSDLDDLLLKYLKGPLRVLIPLLLIMVIMPSLFMTKPLLLLIRHILSLCFIGCLSWFLISIVELFKSFILKKYDVSVKDNLKARMVYTQIEVIERILISIIVIIALSTMLMTFDRVRQVGVSILASAGIIGVIAGFAAQKSIATLFAGIQIAITQPFRIDDVVIVENEWGRIEEITLTYVVVKIWDLRRLVLPITYFLEKPFQNWTRNSADILGTVFIYADYTISIQKVREELQRILKNSELWDGKVAGIQVTDATERTVEIRALMSAGDASAAWDLRCLVREKLLEYIQKNYPESLPKVRAEFQKHEIGHKDV